MRKFGQIARVDFILVNINFTAKGLFACHIDVDKDTDYLINPKDIRLNPMIRVISVAHSLCAEHAGYGLLYLVH